MQPCNTSNQDFIRTLIKQHLDPVNVLVRASSGNLGLGKEEDVAGTQLPEFSKDGQVPSATNTPCTNKSVIRGSRKANSSSAIERCKHVEPLFRYFRMLLRVQTYVTDALRYTRAHTWSPNILPCASLSSFLSFSLLFLLFFSLHFLLPFSAVFTFSVTFGIGTNAASGLINICGIWTSRQFSQRVLIISLSKFPKLVSVSFAQLEFCYLCLLFHYR